MGISIELVGWEWVGGLVWLGVGVWAVVGREVWMVGACLGLLVTVTKVGW